MLPALLLPICTYAPALLPLICSALAYDRTESGDIDTDFQTTYGRVPHSLGSLRKRRPNLTWNVLKLYTPFFHGFRN
jgi:hypothetical protein